MTPAPSELKGWQSGCSVTSQDHLDPVFNKGQDVSLCESVHRTSTCLDATLQIKNYMITTNKNTHICSLIH